MVGMDPPPTSFKQRAFRKLSSEASLRSFLSYDPSTRPISAQSQMSFATCHSKSNTCDSFSLGENHSDDQLLCQKGFFDSTSPLSSSSASVNEKLNKTKLGKKLNTILSRLKTDWNEMMYKKANKTKELTSHKRSATVDVAYNPQDIFTNETFFVHSSDVPQYAGFSSSINSKHYRMRNVTFEVDEDPFAAKLPMKLVAGKPVLPHKRERSLEVSMHGTLFYSFKPFTDTALLRRQSISHYHRLMPEQQFFIDYVSHILTLIRYPHLLFPSRFAFEMFNCVRAESERVSKYEIESGKSGCLSSQ